MVLTGIRDVICFRWSKIFIKQYNTTIILLFDTQSSPGSTPYCSRAAFRLRLEVVAYALVMLEKGRVLRLCEVRSANSQLVAIVAPYKRISLPSLLECSYVEHPGSLQVNCSRSPLFAALASRLASAAASSVSFSARRDRDS